MGATTGIEYVDHTFNPWWGCRWASPGCDNCYAARLAKRTGMADCFESNRRQITGPATWRQPLSWNKAAAAEKRTALVLCGSMCDVFENADCTSDALGLITARMDLYKLIEDTPNLMWVLITKRPENLHCVLPCSWLDDCCPDNVCLCVTVESQEQIGRIDTMTRVPALYYAVSHEPALGPLDLTTVTSACWLNWIITGGETGPGARPMHPDWARADRDAAKANGVPFFFKQWGEWLPGHPREWWERGEHSLPGWIWWHDKSLSAGADKGWVEIDKTTIAQRVGRKRAGALLDGIEHRERLVL